ncbi:MAG: hypothetical protein IJ385_02145 [Ruminiclostridium sp.]|nr:hypothetical protein [Ruminiclostridium sp.]
MSKRCTKCGTFLTDTDRFCPGCGENAPAELENTGSAFDTAAQPQQANTQSQYGQPAPPPYVPSSAPQYNPYPQQEEEMTTGKWLLTIFLTTGFGIISIILLFVWGFGSSAPQAKKNYCKAMLIYQAIAFVLSFILIFVYIFVIAAAVGGELGSEFSDYDYYSSYEMAKNIIGMYL